MKQGWWMIGEQPIWGADGIDMRLGIYNRFWEGMNEDEKLEEDGGCQTIIQLLVRKKKGFFFLL